MPKTRSKAFKGIQNAVNNVSQSHKETAIHAAILNEHYNATKLLLSAGANLDIVPTRQNLLPLSALRVAEQGKKPLILRLIVNRMYDDIKNKKNDFDNISAEDRGLLVKILIKNGTALFTAGEKQRSILEWLSERKSLGRRYKQSWASVFSVFFTAERQGLENGAAEYRSSKCDTTPSWSRSWGQVLTYINSTNSPCPAIQKILVEVQEETEKNPFLSLTTFARKLLNRMPKCPENEKKHFDDILNLIKKAQADDAVPAQQEKSTHANKGNQPSLSASRQSF